MEFDITAPAFWDEQKLGGKLRQVYEVCHSCRRCFNLCPSFNIMFQRIDASSTGEVDGLERGDYRAIEDFCYQCKLCYNHCPYTPPHEFDIDFPRLMLRAKALRSRKEGISRSDRLLADPDRNGRMAARAAPLANWANRSRAGRFVMEKALAIHRDFPLPRFVSEPFESWFQRRFGAVARPEGEPRGKVALFTTCSVNYNVPETGRAAVAVLRRNGQEVSSPAGQVCCGMPALDGGDLEAFGRNAEINLRTLSSAVDDGREIVATGPTCSYVLKKDYPAMARGPVADKVAAHTFDIGEYLVRLARAGHLDREFTQPQGKIAYHLPCHLKSQNIGFRSRDLLAAIPGTTVQMIDACSGVDGTWGMKKEFHDEALKVAEPLLQAIRAAEPDRVVTDCPLAGLQIERGTGVRPVHPVEILRDAYGLADEE